MGKGQKERKPKRDEPIGGGPMPIGEYPPAAIGGITIGIEPPYGGGAPNPIGTDPGGGGSFLAGLFAAKSRSAMLPWRSFLLSFFKAYCTLICLK
jgi:hypothetical protein